LPARGPQRDQRGSVVHVRTDGYLCSTSVLAFLATLTGGGILGIFVRASHERTERARDRLFDAAEKFFLSAEACRNGLAVFRDRTTDEVRTRSANTTQWEIGVPPLWWTPAD